MDLQKDGCILYISSVDLSVGNGPGVNEREFTLALYKAIGERAHFLIPRPVNHVHDLPARVCTYSAPHHKHGMRYVPGHILSTMRLADQILSNRRFDLLLFRLDILPFAPLYITRRHHIPFSLKTVGHGLMTVFDEKFKRLGPSLTFLNRLMVKKLASNALVMDAVSELQTQYLRDILGVKPEKVVWIDNAVNTDRFFPTSAAVARKELGLERFHPIIGYVGNLPHERGGTQLIQAAPRLLPKYPNLGVVILGDGEGRQSLIGLAHKLGVAEHCVLTGYVPFDRVPAYINALDIGVSILLPKSHTASEQKVRQYLACGKPVVASTPGSNDFLADQNLGSLVQYDDLNSIVNELDRWLSLSADGRAELSARAYRYACDNLSVEQSVTRRIALWNRCLNPQRTEAVLLNL